MKFYKLTHIDPLNCIHSYKFQSLKIQDGITDGCHFEKSPLLTNGSIDLHEIWQHDALWPSLPLECQNSECLKSKIADSCHFEQEGQHPLTGQCAPSISGGT